MVKILVQRTVLLSVASSVLNACIPDKGIGRFAKELIELVKLLTIVMTVLEIFK